MMCPLVVSVNQPQNVAGVSWGDDNTANSSTYSSKNRVVFISILALLYFESKCISVLLDFKPFSKLGYWSTR